MRSSARRVAFFVAFGVLVPLAACGTAAFDVDICNQIESTRCTAAANLNCPGFHPEAPFSDAWASTPAENAATCIRYYSVACLHGLYTGYTPPTKNLQDCVGALADASTCAQILDPLEAGVTACRWLAEAGPDGDATPVVDVVTDVPTPLDIVVPPVDTGLPDVVRDFEACPEGGCLP